MRVLTASDRAVLVECADLDEAMRMHRAWAGMPGVLERVPGAGRAGGGVGTPV